MTCRRGSAEERALDCLRSLDQAVQMYALDHGGEKPNKLEELVEPTAESETGYLQSNTVPLDPWGNPFIYRPPTEPTGDDYEIISLGNDGAVGGSGHAADIKLSELRDR
ncbi:MAG: type II secretion system protein GspG [Planctomycetota bacterium]